MDKGNEPAEEWNEEELAHCVGSEVLVQFMTGDL